MADILAYSVYDGATSDRFADKGENGDKETNVVSVLYLEIFFL